MKKYYTRACNFYYGKSAKRLILKNRAFPLCGNTNLAFDKIEIFSRDTNNISSKTIKIKDINLLNSLQKKKVKLDLINITSKRKNFLKNINFSKPNIMGILNLTPDSFSDGGKYNKKDKSFKHISNMIQAGAKIVDVGGESTRPGSSTISNDNEWKRIKFVIKNFKKKYKNISLSVDTRKTEIMLKAISNKADLINDVSGFNYDKDSLYKLKKFKTSKVIHHMQGTPNTMQIKPMYKNVLLDIYDFFEDKINCIGSKNLILDPGIGFGKTLKHNLTLISKISLFHSLGLPILVGTSRKRFINQISGKHDSKLRLGGTIASVLFLLLQGVQLFRVHDVKEIKQSIMVFEKILSNFENE